MTFRPIAIALALSGAAAAAQQKPAPALGPDDVAALARVHVAVSAVHDSMDAQLAQQRNKKPDLQRDIRNKFQAQIDAILAKAGLNDSSYAHRSFLITTNASYRRTFDSVVVTLTGAPIPGQVAAAPPSAMVAVPAGPVGVEIGFIVNAAPDTPNKQGLLAVAMTEARTAIQHAQLASRQPTNVAYMKTHIGHVVNAIDPAIVGAGPGTGYGLKKAASGIAEHLEKAAAAREATGPQLAHAGHALASTQNVLERAQHIVELAERLQATSDPAVAAGIVSQVVSLADQLVAGADANGDGRITWEKGEGGLQQVDDHIKLLLGSAP
ncbi:MAG: hypothetical protein U9Q74_13665 [Gemmatimonadota bacterium]|nr:hypothetical protein [Gemmatimonadota bacterium]